MIRKLLFPALLAGLLGGCVSTGYGHHDGYYYSVPSVELRVGYHYPYGYYAYPYLYGYYPYGGYHYRYYGYPYYGYPYRYAYPYRHGYGYPHRYGGHGYYHNHRGKPRPPHGHDDGDDNPPPWRDFDRRRRMGEVAGGALEAQGTIRPRSQPQLQPQPATRDAPRREPRSDESRAGQAAPRAQEPRRRQGDNVHEPR
jgi:hypothetical protein